MAETCIQLRDKSILFFLPLSTNSCVHQLNTVSPQHWHAATLWALSEWDKKHKCATELSWETKQHRYKGCLPHDTQSLNPMLILKYWLQKFYFHTQGCAKVLNQGPRLSFLFLFFCKLPGVLSKFFFRHWLLFNKFTVNIVEFLLLLLLSYLTLTCHSFKRQKVT